MDEAEEVVEVILVADHQPAIVAQPGEQPLYLPPAPVASERSAVLGLGTLASSSVRSDHLDALISQPLIERVRVVGSVSNQMLRQGLYEATLKSRLNKGDLMRASRFSVSGERKTSAVCHCHELRALTPLGLSHSRSPFLATTNVPSMKHSLISSPPLCFRSSAKASSTLASVSSLTHDWKRRWQVWYGGYLSGRSFQGAPVRSIHSTPLSTSRLSRQGLPLPSSRLGGSPINGSSIAHCSSVRSIATSSHHTNVAYHLFMR